MKKVILVNIFVFLVCSVSFADSSNIAPLSSLKNQYPGYVDGVTEAIGSEPGQGGGPALNYYINSNLTLTWNRLYRINKVIIYFGCNDGETFDGEIHALVNGSYTKVAIFKSKRCGDALTFPETTTDKIILMMTGGGGKDKNISVQEIECYGK